ncbi:MAG: hypothetical protein NC225_08760 [Clostridium sp.]|nr:hypothetical protein [Clostridium sp.]MCM1460108.1 hypothetical protein [Bacteroides sp.]
MKRKVIAILLSLMLFGGTALQTYDSKAISLSVSTNGPLNGNANSSGTLQVYWSNTQGESKLTAGKDLKIITVSVSFGSSYSSKSKEYLSSGDSLIATKDVGYKHSSLYGSSVYEINN